MCTPQEDPTLSEWETEFSQQFDNLMSKYLELDIAAGEKQSVLLSQSFAKEHGVSRLATVEFDESRQQTIFRAGPTEFETVEHTIPEVKIESMIPFMEAYRDGLELPKLSDVISKGVQIRKKESNPVVTQISFLESYLFRMKENILMIDPSQGSIYRALEENKNVYYYMTATDSHWKKELDGVFKSMFKGKKLIFKHIHEEDDVEDFLVYHGANGFKPVYQPNSFALEPNPYSIDTRKQGAGIATGGESISFYYQIKDRKMEYIFKYHPNHYRIDPATLNYLGVVKGDAFFLGMTVNPKELGYTLDTGTKAATVGEMYCYQEMPEYRDYDGMSVSYDDLYVYDVKIPSTCASRRFKVEQISKEMGKKMKPYSTLGKYVAHPYSVTYTLHDWETYDNIVVQQRGSLSKMAIMNEINLEYTGPISQKAAIFILGDKTGKRVTPLESFGSVFPVDLYVALKKTNGSGGEWWYPDIRPFVGKSGMVFDSINSLKNNIHLLCYFCVPDLKPTDLYGRVDRVDAPNLEYADMTDLEDKHGEQEEQEQQNMVIEEDEALHMKIRKIFEMEKRDLFYHELEIRLPGHLTRKITATLMQTSNWHIIMRGINYHEDIWTTCTIPWEPVDDGNRGLASYPDATTLKRAILDGLLEFEDSVSINTRPQQEYLDMQGVELIGQRVNKKTQTLMFRPFDNS
jgi:hypothetical protein